MRVTVGRTYRFRAMHVLPDFPEPWCFPHMHDYTIEVTAIDETPTDDIDARMNPLVRDLHGADLEQHFDEYTTVESLAAVILGDLRRELGDVVVAVTVWEDQARWGRAEA